MMNAEVHFAQKLASNLPSVRDKALRKIGKWFEKISSSNEALNEELFMKIWKGIYFYFWHCDKMLNQEEKADVISGYLHIFKSFDYSLLYLDTFLATMVREWHGIDRYRLEKFLMLIRRMLNQSYKLLQMKKWNLKCLKSFFQVLKKTVINPSVESAPFGLKIHISDIYMEELAKVASDEITPKILRKFLNPYLEILCYCDDASLLSSVKKDIFLYLVNQDADAAKFHDFPLLKFKPTAIQKLLLKQTSQPNVTRKNIKLIHSIVKEYENFKNNICLAERIFKAQKSNKKLRKRAIEAAALSLVEEEEQFRKQKKEFKKKHKVCKE